MEIQRSSQVQGLPTKGKGTEELLTWPNLTADTTDDLALAWRLSHLM